MDEIIEALWIFLPAGLANAAPVIANRIPGLNRWQTPIDLGRTFRGKRILGDNKTWRGIFAGTLLACLVGFLQQLIWHTTEHTVITVTIAGLLGFGALYGDAVESFFKRQSGIPAGRRWFPFDQLDYIVGGLIAVSPLMLFSWRQIIAITVVYFGLHLLVAYIGYLLKLKDTPV